MPQIQNNLCYVTRHTLLSSVSNSFLYSECCNSPQRTTISLCTTGTLCYSFIHSFIHSSMALYSPLLGPGLFFSFVIIFTQMVELLGPVISPSQGRYLNTGRHKRRINANTDIHSLSPRYLFDRRLGGPQGRSGRREEEKNLDLIGTRTPTPRSSSL
jgi:hypothetical protein